MPIYHIIYNKKGYVLGERCNLNAIVRCGSKDGAIARIITADMTIVSIKPIDMTPDSVYYIEEYN